MKFNLKLIALMLILCFISISAVSAVDTAQADEIVADADSGSIGNIDEDMIANDGDQDSPKTFEELQDIIWHHTKEGDTVELDSDYIYVYNETNKRQPEWGIQIDKAITLDGRGHTLDGANKAAILYIANGLSNVTIKNVKFVNGVKSNGGAIVAYETNYLTIENCTFKNNKATGSVGGALMIEGSNCKITDSTFENNVAPSSGGAIRIEGDSNTVSNNIFTANKATESLGGAISALGHYNTITNSTFTKNFAGRDGGAIDAEGTHVEDIGYGIIISNNIFDSNVASGSNEGSHGGAVSMACENSEVTNNNFTNNHADSIKGAPASIGGAIRWNGNSNMGKITGNNFEGDYAQSGGAIYVAGNGITIDANKFNNNKATAGNGGALNIKGKYAVITNNEITKSSSKESGGAIFLEGKKSKIISNDISGCSAGNDGGAAYINGASATIKGNKFSYNNAGQLAGALFLKSSDAVIKSNEFTKNVAKSSGGAAYIVASKSTLSYNTFTKNTAQVDSVGGAVRWTGDDASITKNTFTKNSAKNTGMAIYGSGENVQLVGNKYTPYQSNTQRWEQIKVRAATPTFVFKYTKTKKVIVTLKSVYKKALSNKKITLKVNGKTYKGYTNYKGQAVIKIYLNKKGLYKYTAKFSGDINYYSISQKGLIKIK